MPFGVRAPGGLGCGGADRAAVGHLALARLGPRGAYGGETGAV